MLEAQRERTKSNYGAYPKYNLSDRNKLVKKDGDVVGAYHCFIQSIEGCLGNKHDRVDTTCRDLSRNSVLSFLSDSPEYDATGHAKAMTSLTHPRPLESVSSLKVPIYDADPLPVLPIGCNPQYQPDCLNLGGWDHQREYGTIPMYMNTMERLPG